MVVILRRVLQPMLALRGDSPVSPTIPPQLMLAARALGVTPCEGVFTTIRAVIVPYSEPDGILDLGVAAAKIDLAWVIVVGIIVVNGHFHIPSS